MSLIEYKNRLVSFLFGPEPNTRQILIALGLGAVASVALPELANFFAWTRLHVFHSSKLYRYQHAPLLEQTDETLNLQAWALVTGATDGIGRAFVDEFASRNINVILHGRNPEKLSRIIDELKAKHPRLHFESFLCDATDRASWHGKFAELVPSLRRRNINLTILVNNVGGNPAPLRSFSRLQDWTPSEVNGILDMNVTFPTQITRALLPILLDNRPSLILNIASLSGMASLQWLTPYSASKAYGNHFAKALSMEIKAEGLADDEEKSLEVLSLMTGEVQSAGLKVETSFFVPSSRDFVRTAVHKIGCGEVEAFGTWRHSLQNYLVGCLADSARAWFTIRYISKLKSDFEKEAQKQK